MTSDFKEIDYYMNFKGIVLQIDVNETETSDKGNRWWGHALDF